MRQLARTRLAFALLALGIGAAPAHAGWREDLKTLRVGFIAGDNPAAGMARMEGFRWQLQVSLAVPVELFPAKTYGALIDAEASGRVQYAILSSLAFVALDQRCHCVEPIAVPTTADHQPGFRAFIVARADGPVRGLEDARGLSLAVGRQDSISGRLAPFAAMEAQGIEPDSYFARLVEADDSLGALRQLAAGKADLAVAWSMSGNLLDTTEGAGPVADLAASGDGQVDALRVVWQSDVIPFGPHAVRKDLPDAAKLAIASMLTTLQSAEPDVYDTVEPTLPGGFAPGDPALYRQFASLLAAAVPADPTPPGSGESFGAP